jgi:hypothetical protein
MAVLIEAISVVVRRDRIDERYTSRVLSCGSLRASQEL